MLPLLFTRALPLDTLFRDPNEEEDPPPPAMLPLRLEYFLCMDVGASEISFITTKVDDNGDSDRQTHDPF
tara:strand:+ start:268 stop:477 length:210 start_codon:yes stop_codon:yes gene_type:complete